MVGKEPFVDQVEHEIRRKLGEPIHPFFLMKSRYTEIEKIRSEEQYEMLKKEKKPITLYLCASAKNDNTAGDFCLRSIDEKMQSKILKKNIILVKGMENTDADVKDCVKSLVNISEIKTLFNNTQVLLLSSKMNNDSDIQYDVALLIMSLYILAASIVYLKRKRKVHFL